MARMEESLRAMDTLVRKVEETVKRHRMLPERGSVVLGVSGGPDSQALLHVIWELRNRSCTALRLHAGHLHHGMRGASADQDAEFVKAECARLGVACTVERVDVPRFARERGVGEEVAGREARYDFLTRLALTTGSDRILLGHQADDQAETVLMRVMRGAGPRGIGGIPYRRRVAGCEKLFVVRPLLDCSRAEIERYLSERGLASRLDATNLSLKYLRNTVRMRILPAMEREWGGGLRTELRRLAGAARRLSGFADDLCRLFTGTSPSVGSGDVAQTPRRNASTDFSVVPLTSVIQEDLVEADARRLRSLPLDLQSELVRHLLMAAGMWTRALGRRDYERIGRLLQRNRGSLCLPGGVAASCYNDVLALYKEASRADIGFEVELHVPGRTFVPLLKADLEAEVLEGGEEMVRQRRGESEEFLDYEKIQGPLFARFWRPGDRMKPLGSLGRKKLQDIFTDLHLPRWRRTRTLLVTMRGAPIWVVGVRISDEVKLTKRTRRVLRLRLVGAH